MRVRGGHHEGRNYSAPGCVVNPPFPKYCRIVYIDIRKLKWCSIDSVVFHSFIWPSNVKEAKGIARTLFTNHCDWADVLIVRGRCFSSNKVCFRANRVLENLLWNWSTMRRPYVVYQEGNEATSVCDPVPLWFTHERVHKDLCQCPLVGPCPQGWHRRGALYSNVVGRRHQLFEKRCGCSQVEWQFLSGCTKNTKNQDIAIRLSGTVIHVVGRTATGTPKR